MRKHIQFVCMIALLVSSVGISAQDFEGVITMTKVVDEKDKVTTFTVKGTLVLVSMSTKNGPAWIIHDRNDGMSTSLFSKNGKKFAYISKESEQKENPLDDRQKMIMDLAQKQLSIEITGETRQIGPYLCSKITGQDHREYVEAWVTDKVDLSLFDLFPRNQSAESQSLDLQKMIWEKGFIMEYWTKNKSTGIINKISFSIFEQPVSDDVFTYSKEEYYEFTQTTLNNLYTQSAKDPKKMQELRELLEAFNTD